ncbi:GTPase IMAP family member GIMD1-like isoform X2 [Nelusetta ayraudi]
MMAFNKSHLPDIHPENVLSLNVLLLGEKQSGRSSVGNALIGGEEFQTGACLSGNSTTTECQLLHRNFPNFFRRQGAESDLILRVVDTPPILPRSYDIARLCPEGVHILVLVLRVDLVHTSSHLEECLQSLLGPDWHHHTLLVLTHADQLKEAGLQPSAFLRQASDRLRALSDLVRGGVHFIDNSCDWPLIRGRQLRDQLLHLSARNHHRSLVVRTDISL